MAAPPPKRTKHPLLIPIAVGLLIWWWNPIPLLGLIGLGAVVLGVLAAGGTFLVRRKVGI